MTHSAPFAAVKWKQNFIIWFIWSNFLCFNSPWAAPTARSSALLPTPQKSHKSPAKQLISYFIAMIDLPFLQSVFPRYWQAGVGGWRLLGKEQGFSPTNEHAKHKNKSKYNSSNSILLLSLPPSEADSEDEMWLAANIFSVFILLFFQTQIFRIIYFGVVSQNFSRFTRRMNDNNIIIVRTKRGPHVPVGGSSFVSFAFGRRALGVHKFGSCFKGIYSSSKVESLSDDDEASHNYGRRSNTISGV